MIVKLIKRKYILVVEKSCFGTARPEYCSIGYFKWEVVKTIIKRL